jgi:hypothetical protein
VVRSGYDVRPTQQSKCFLCGLITGFITRLISYRVATVFTRRRLVTVLNNGGIFCSRSYVVAGWLQFHNSLLDWLLNCCWPSAAQWSLVPSPMGLMTMFYCLTVLGAFRTLLHSHSFFCLVRALYITPARTHRKHSLPQFYCCLRIRCRGHVFIGRYFATGNFFWRNCCGLSAAIS